MISPSIQRKHPLPTTFWGSMCAISVFMLYTVFLTPSKAHASISNRLNRLEIRQKTGYTRLAFNLENYSKSKIISLPDNRLRLVIDSTNGPLFKKYRRYSDRNIGGLVFTQRGDELLITFQIGKNVGWRIYNFEGVEGITVDVGTALATPPALPSVPGREKIKGGVGKLVRDFDPPLKTDIPFTPTDRQLLAKLLDPEEQKLFSAGESALYKGQFTEAEEIIAPFANRTTPIKALALYRLGDIWYNLQKYQQALTAFREAERLWPAFLSMNPAVTFYYGDSIVRSGDLPHGRELLGGLISRLSDKKFAPTLLVRLGDIYSRAGHETEANGLYMSVAKNFPANKASKMAQLRLNDQNFMAATQWNYRSLSNSYQEISEQIGDFDMREEALFKHVLLEALHAETHAALQKITAFQRKFPRGSYTTVARTIRESLVAQMYRENDWTKDPAALIRLLDEQQEYLADTVEQPGFLKIVSSTYDQIGRPIERIRLFSLIVDRQWAGNSAPALYEEIADNADMIGDSGFAIKTLRTFLRKYPTNPSKNHITEKLGALLFNEAKYLDVKNTLDWLLDKKSVAQFPESYYFLGKSSWNLKEYPTSVKAFDHFFAAARTGNKYLPDAYYIAASAHQSTGDKKGALKLIDTAVKLPENLHNEAILYKAGQINLQIGNQKQAKLYLDEIIQKGKDQDWKRLAQQELIAAGLK